MNSHQQQIIKALLDTLLDPQGVNGGLLAEALLHAGVIERTTPPATLTEFEAMLKVCELAKWIDSARGKLNSLRWAITDAGRVARRDM